MVVRPKRKALEPPPNPPPKVQLDFEVRPVSAIHLYPNNPRHHPDNQIEALAASIRLYGFVGVIVVDEDGVILAGHGRYAAAILLGMDTIPTIVVTGLSEGQKKGLRIADNKLPLGATWDEDKLIVELNAVRIELRYEPLEISTSFTTAEYDILASRQRKKRGEQDLDALPVMPSGPFTTQKGDLWACGPHKLFCGDSRRITSFAKLMRGEQARMVLSDPPFNVPVAGHMGGLGRIKHDEFAMASGEMTRGEFTDFLTLVFENECEFSVDGALHYQFMDWRHFGEMEEAGRKIYSELKNVCTWAKSQPGMGSHYRSQTEFIFVWKYGTRKHVNNVELGKWGRSRSNLWECRAASKTGKSSELSLHPSSKPVQLLMDAVLDATHPDDIVLDAFGGSGGLVVACEQVGRVARLIEFEPKYCDVTLQRWLDVTGIEPILVETGESFSQVQTRRLKAVRAA